MSKAGVLGNYSSLVLDGPLLVLAIVAVPVGQMIVLPVLSAPGVDALGLISSVVDSACLCLIVDRLSRASVIVDDKNFSFCETGVLLVRESVRSSGGKSDRLGFGVVHEPFTRIASWLSDSESVLAVADVLVEENDSSFSVHLGEDSELSSGLELGASGVSLCVESSDIPLLVLAFVAIPEDDLVEGGVSASGTVGAEFLVLEQVQVVEPSFDVLHPLGVVVSALPGSHNESSVSLDWSFLK